MDKKTDVRDPDEKVVEIEMERLRAFSNHPFKVIGDSQMIELQDSIKKYGVLNPLIVRPKIEGYYEIISGHRRKYAAEKLGYKKIPVIICMLQDDEAVVIMVDSNLQREQITPSEKAYAYKMKYDATRKTTVDAWREFRNKCSKRALVIMPVQTGELREFAIKNNLFVLNLNKELGDAGAGQNISLLEEVLAWLEPNAPVYGWEQGVSEDQFVARVSKSGHPMIPCDWSYNHSLLSLLYEKGREQVLPRIFDPRSIDFKKKKNFVSFFLSDGDNIQWMMQDFASRYYDIPEAEDVKMTFGLPVATLAMMAPVQFNNLMGLQKQNCSLMEMLGGGYYYVDTYSQDHNRKTNLRVAAKRLAVSMRQYQIKLLGIMAMDVKSEAAKEAYQVYVDANDQLEGIVVLQYSPYAGGEGEVFWVTNKAGYDIPVITVKYSLWDRIHEREGSPDFIASKLKEEAQEESFSVVCVHAWSRFEGDTYGASAAKRCAERLDDRFEAINMQELVWRLRMSRRPEQTLDYLNKIY